MWLGIFKINWQKFGRQLNFSVLKIKKILIQYANLFLEELETCDVTAKNV
jgi:hypothetical protein